MNLSGPRKSHAARGLSKHRHSHYPRDPHSGEDEDNEGYDYWYLDGRPAFKANSAFTLYGILKNDTASENGGSVCNKGTYINSFFTTHGVETIADPFGISGSDGDGSYVPSSECVEADRRELGDQEERVLGGNRDHREGDSYGTACYDGQFVFGKFSGPYCIGSTVTAIIDTFDDFNAEMQNITCRQIYSEEGSVAYGRSYHGGEGRKLEEVYDDGYNNGDDAYNDNYNDGYDDGYNNGDGYDDGYNNGDDASVSYDPFTILEYSAACSLTLYPDFCPDPYGLKKDYEKTLEIALKSRPVMDSGRGKQAMKIVSAVFFSVGLALFGSAFFIKKMAGERRIKDVNDAMSPAPRRRARFIKLISSSSFNKACKLKEKFQDFAEEEVSSPQDSANDSPQVSIIETPAPASPAAEQIEDEPYGYVQVVDSQEPKLFAAPLFTPEPSPTAAATPAASLTPAKREMKQPMLNEVSKSLFGSEDSNTYTGISGKSSSSSASV